MASPEAPPVSAGAAPLDPSSVAPSTAPAAEPTADDGDSRDSEGGAGGDDSSGD